ETGLVAACCVLTEDDLAFSVIDLADLARAVACVPALFKAEHVDVEARRSVHVGNKKHRARVPSMDLISYRLLCHDNFTSRPNINRFSLFSQILISYLLRTSC